MRQHSETEVKAAVTPESSKRSLGLTAGATANARLPVGADRVGE